MAPPLLKLQFLSQARLWSEVVVSGGERVFVPTTQALMVGQSVEVEIEAPEVEDTLKVRAVVQELRALGPEQPAGAWVKVDEASLEECRKRVAGRDEAVRTAGRKEFRVDCLLSAGVLLPQAMSGCTVKTLSPHGLTLRTPQPLEKHAKVELKVQLPDGSEALVRGPVMWTKPDLKLAGLKLMLMDEAMERRVQLAVEMLKRAQTPSAPSTVLVADDDTSILDFTSRVVSKAGHRAVRAQRGDVALELIRAQRPDLVFLDVLMPGLDGLEVCRAIRADAALARTPVILLSAMGEGRLAEAAKSAGADGFLTKPMRLEALRVLLAERLNAK